MSKGSSRLLVVEDELELRVYLDMALRCLGYKVELAQDGVEALECLQTGGDETEAVLLDLIMPNKDGFDALREIRQVYPDLPVIILSGAPSPVNIVTAMKSGATDFLCKPGDHARAGCEDCGVRTPLEEHGSAKPGLYGYEPADECHPVRAGAGGLVRGAGFDSGGDGFGQGNDRSGTARQFTAG